MINNSIFIITLAAAFNTAQAAIPKLSIDDALKLPAEERPQALRKRGPQAYKDLRDVAFDTSKPYDLRWRAVVGMAWMGGKESLVDLEKAVASNDWFLRDAALKGLEKVDQEKAKTWARQLLSDSALVVRSSAVRVLHNLNDKESEKLLWEKLSAIENFRGSQSLFIRKQIVMTLSDFAGKEDLKEFAKLLQDKDSSVQKAAIVALEKITGERMDENPRLAIGQWHRYLAKNKITQ